MINGSEIYIVRVHGLVKTDKLSLRITSRLSNGKFQTCFNFTDNCRTIFFDTVLF